MACLQTLNGIAQDCSVNLAGIKKVYLANFDDVDSVTIDADTHTISAISMTTGAKFYGYNFAKQTGSLTSTMTKNEQNGTRYYTNELALVFNKLEAQKHLEIEALGAGQLASIVEDNNGKAWYVGYDMYLSATANTAQTGTSVDDLSGYNTTLSAQSAYLPFEIAKSVYAAIIEEPA